MDAATKEHFDKYDALARKLGLSALAALVPVNRDRILKAMTGERELNNVPLDLWDGQFRATHQLAIKAGLRAWSLGENVCVLKHVARHYIAKGEHLEYATQEWGVSLDDKLNTEYPTTTTTDETQMIALGMRDKGPRIALVNLLNVRAFLSVAGGWREKHKKATKLERTDALQVSVYADDGEHLCDIGHDGKGLDIVG